MIEISIPVFAVILVLVVMVIIGAVCFGMVVTMNRNRNSLIAFLEGLVEGIDKVIDKYEEK